MIGRTLRVYPTLLRVGFAEMVAYRAEFLIWVLSTNLPLVMMGLWTAVAAEGPIGRFDRAGFVAYYLAMLAARILTGSWLVWELTMDIRQGTLATRLLRPVHPLIAYSAQHLAAVPLRVLVVSPLLLVLALVAHERLPWTNLPLMFILVAALAGAWLLLFLTMLVIGTLALFVESALSVFDLWLAVHAVLSGYLVPLELLPPWVEALARALPFRYMLGFPVEVMVGLLPGPAAARDLLVQWVYVAAMLLLARLVWNRGMRRFVAFGG